LPMAFAGMNSEDARDKGMEILKLVGLEHRSLHKPAEMSGGQQQRVAVARALANSPSIILADEPTANLDSATGSALLDMMRKLNEDKGITFIFSTHDRMIMERAKRLVMLHDGKIKSDEKR